MVEIALRRPQIGDSLAEFLVVATPDPKLRQLMMSLSEAIRTISFKVGPCTPMPAEQGSSACPPCIGEHCVAARRVLGC